MNEEPQNVAIYFFRCGQQNIPLQISGEFNPKCYRLGKAMSNRGLSDNEVLKFIY